MSTTNNNNNNYNNKKSDIETEMQINLFSGKQKAKIETKTIISSSLEEWEIKNMFFDFIQSIMLGRNIHD